MSETRTVIVCMPAGRPIDWFSASEILDWHQQPAGTPQPFFPVRRSRLFGWASRWSDHHLVQAARGLGAITRAAGGRRGRLDLTAAAVTANAEASARWRTWAQVVRDTPPTRPWAEFLAAHTAGAKKLSREEAVRRLEAQPRGAGDAGLQRPSGRPASARSVRVGRLPGRTGTYTVVHWRHAIASDALITDDCRLLQPASVSLADRLRSLAEAGAYLRGLSRRHQLLAVNVTT